MGISVTRPPGEKSHVVPRPHGAILVCRAQQVNPPGLEELAPQPEESWLVCADCNRRLNNTEFKTSVRSAFESYQLALGRVLQDRQSKLA